VDIRATKPQKHHRAPRNIRLRALGAKSLPASVRVLYAKRLIRGKRFNRYELLFVAVNKAGGATGAMGPPALAAKEHDDVDLMDVLVAFLGGKVRPHKCHECGADVEAGLEDECEECIANRMWAESETEDYPSSGPRQNELLKERWTEGGDPSAVFDKTVETGHYDDGHAFGWNVNGAEKVERTIEQVVLDAVIEPDILLQNLEQNAGTDLDGNGSVGQQINTVVGPPAVM
jgi:hypothetical protein